MFLGKAIKSTRLTSYDKWMSTAALAIVYLLFSGYRVAPGQTLDLVEEPSTVSVVAPLSTADLSLNATESISLLPVDLPKSTVTEPLPEALCEFHSVTQNIQLRKNVLGCKACYTVLPHDEIWVISVRDCCCDPENVSLFKVRKLENSCWQPSSLEALTKAHQCDTSRTTMMYVHGNQTNYQYGVARGFQFYNNLFVKYDCPRAPLRLVLWVWKSERELPRLYPDYLVKSQRAVLMGKTLTKTLESFGNRRMAIVGFSLGAQVVLSSLEEMEPACRCEANTSTDDKYQIAMIAPATDPAYICDVIDRNVESSIVGLSTIIVNSDDRAVKAMRLVVRRECPEAHDTFSKLARCHRFPLGPTEFFEVSQEISRKHAIERYTRAPSAQRAMNQVLNRVAADVY